MIDSFIHAALAQQALSHQGRAAARAVVLGDGSRALVRPLHAGDAHLVADVFDQLSDESRWMQFLAAKKELSAAELRYLTDIDHHDHEALAALDHAAGRGAGVARFIRHTADPRAAELSVTVVDAWQGRGLGTELLTQLSARARQEGVERFTAVASADNVAVARLLRAVSARVVSHEYDTVEYEIDLAHARARALASAREPERLSPSGR
ncbi:MAG TPA: GNAT family N-acetyltransferase [Trebonia sp.]|nr:GNAT family N-acetyltransferase [Trebonia sp.]